MTWSEIKNDLLMIFGKIEQFAEKAGAEIWSIFQRVFTAEEALLMSQAYTLIKADAVSIQNDAPGTKASVMGQQLLANAKNSLASLEGPLAVTAIITVIGAVMHDLGIADTQGNAGVLN